MQGACEKISFCFNSPEKILIKMCAKTPGNGIAGRRGEFKMGRVWLFGRQNMCDNIAAPYNSPVM